MCNKIDGASVEASLSAFDLDSIMTGKLYESLSVYFLFHLIYK